MHEALNRQEINRVCRHMLHFILMVIRLTKEKRPSVGLNVIIIIMA
jgi:predicted secreted protein